MGVIIYQFSLHDLGCIRICCSCSDGMFTSEGMLCGDRGLQIWRSWQRTFIYLQGKMILFGT